MLLTCVRLRSSLGFCPTGNLQYIEIGKKIVFIGVCVCEHSLHSLLIDSLSAGRGVDRLFPPR